MLDMNAEYVNFVKAVTLKSRVQGISKVTRPMSPNLGALVSEEMVVLHTELYNTATGVYLGFVTTHITRAAFDLHPVEKVLQSHFDPEYLRHIHLTPKGWDYV